MGLQQGREGMHEALEHDGTRLLVAALLGDEPVRVRKRWALLQLALWQEQGLAEDLGEGRYRLTPLGRQRLGQLQTEQQILAAGSAEARLQALGLELPARCHRQVLGALLHGDRQHAWPEVELTALRESGIEPSQDGLLRLRSAVPFSLFFSEGGMLDAAPILATLGELALPEPALARLTKLLWAQAPAQRVLTVSRRSGYVSLPLESGQLLLLSPPECPALATRFMQAMTPGVAWGQVGDLHPQALAQAQALAEALGRPLRLALPVRWPEFVRHYAQPLPEGQRWSATALGSGLAALLAPLVDSGSWLPLEAYCLGQQWQLLG